MPLNPNGPNKSKQKTPRRRTLLIGGLLVATMGFAVWLYVNNFQPWRLYPLFFPQHVCFTSDGVDTGQAEHCLIRDARAAWKIYEQRSMGTTDSPFTSVYTGCQKACQANSHCTHYVVSWPEGPYKNSIFRGHTFTIIEDDGFSCSLLKSKGTGG